MQRIVLHHADVPKGIVGFVGRGKAEVDTSAGSSVELSLLDWFNFFKTNSFLASFTFGGSCLSFQSVLWFRGCEARRIWKGRGSAGSVDRPVRRSITRCDR